MLEEYDARGTFYIAGGLVDAWSGNWTGLSADDIVGLHRRGHEIACHTFSHTRATDLTAAAMAAELEKNRRYLLGLDSSIRIENFAYPYGTGSVLREAPARKSLPFLARHPARRQQRHRGPAISARRAADRPADRP